MKFAKETWRVKILLPKKSSEQLLNFIRAAGIEFEFVDAHTDLQPAPTLKRKIERRFRKFVSELRFASALRQRHFDIVQIDAAPWQSFWLMLFLLRRSHVFVTVHNRMPEIEKWRFWFWKTKLSVLARSTRFHLFAANQDAKKSLRIFVAPDFYNRIRVTYASIDKDEIVSVANTRLDKQAILNLYKLPSDKFLVFCVGQFIDRKGRWIFIEAAKQVVNEFADAHFVWITNSTVTAAEREQIKQHGVENSFTLLESDNLIQTHEQLLILIKTANLFVLPSYVEGLPIALLEAMALGIPVISTAINGIPEAITHGETGWLIEPGDSRELSKAIVALYSNESLRNKIGKAGSDLVFKNFAQEATAQIAIAEYDSTQAR